MRGGEDLACIFCTGGTTGRAKGVMLSHRNLWANAVVAGAQLGFDDNTVSLHAGPLFHLVRARAFTRPPYSVAVMLLFRDSCRGTCGPRSRAIR